MSGEACKFSVDVCRPPNSWHRSLKYQGSRERPHPQSTDLRTAEEDGWPQSQRPVAVSLRAAAAAAVGGCSHRPSAGAWSHRPGQWGEYGPHPVSCPVCVYVCVYTCVCDPRKLLCPIKTTGLACPGLCLFRGSFLSAGVRFDFCRGKLVDWLLPVLVTRTARAVIYVHSYALAGSH